MGSALEERDAARPPGILDAATGIGAIPAIPGEGHAVFTVEVGVPLADPAAGEAAGVHARRGVGADKVRRLPGCRDIAADRPLILNRTLHRVAFAVGEAVIVNVTSSITALQLPFPTLVRSRVTDPADISAALGE